MSIVFLTFCFRNEVLNNIPFVEILVREPILHIEKGG